MPEGMTDDPLLTGAELPPALTFGVGTGRVVPDEPGGRCTRFFAMGAILADRVGRVEAPSAGGQPVVAARGGRTGRVGLAAIRRPPGRLARDRTTSWSV